MRVKNVLSKNEKAGIVRAWTEMKALEEKFLKDLARIEREQLSEIREGKDGCFIGPTELVTGIRYYLPDKKSCSVTGQTRYVLYEEDILSLIREMRRHDD